MPSKDSLSQYLPCFFVFCWVFGHISSVKTGEERKDEVRLGDERRRNLERRKMEKANINLFDVIITVHVLMTK